ncbi:hypothetical protein RCL1_000976 [Eukaryota sp. TZLM3-RCL]
MLKLRLLLIVFVTTVFTKTLFISSGLSSTDHFKNALASETYDYIEATSFRNIDFAQYDKVLVALSGLHLSTLDTKLLSAFVKNSGHLVIFGGSMSHEFRNTLPELISFNYSSWTSELPSANQFSHDTGCTLSKNLPKLSVLNSKKLKVFGVIADTEARVCQRSSYNGVPTAVAKVVGNGHLVYIPLPADDIYTDPNDFKYFKTLLLNSLEITKTGAMVLRGNNLLVLSWSLLDLLKTREFESIVSDYYKNDRFPYNVLHTLDYSQIPLEYFDHVIVYINVTNGPSQAAWDNVYKAVRGGLKLSLFGNIGKNAQFLNKSQLLSVEYFSDFKFSSGNFLSTFYNRHNHGIVKNVPTFFNVKSSELRQYTLDINDPNALVILRNKELVPIVVTKKVGYGSLVYGSFAFSQLTDTVDLYHMTLIINNVFGLTIEEVNPNPPKLLFAKSRTDPQGIYFNTTESLIASLGVNFNSVTSLEYVSLTDVSQYDTVVLAYAYSPGNWIYAETVARIKSWMELKGKRVVFIGGSKDLYFSQRISEILEVRQLPGAFLRKSEAFDLVIDGSFDYLTTGLPHSYEFFNPECSTSFVDISDPLARTPIKRQDGFGMPFIAAKAINSGVYVHLDLALECLLVSEYRFLSILLSNAIKLTSLQARRTSIPSLAVLVVDESKYVSAVNYKIIQEALRTKLLKYDLLAPYPINVASLSHYSDIIILYNNSFNHSVEISSLVENGKRVFFMGTLVGSNRIPIVHDNSFTFKQTAPHFKVWNRNHVLTNNLPLNVTFNFNPVQSILPRCGHDAMIVALTGNNYPLLLVKALPEWNGGTFTMFTFSGEKLHTSDVSDSTFFGLLFTNWLRLTPNDCVVVPKKHVVQIIGQKFEELPHFLDTIQYALHGKPLYQGEPQFDLAFGTFAPVDYSIIDTLLLSIGCYSPEFRCPTVHASLLMNVANVLKTCKLDVFFAGGTSSSDFATAFDKYLFPVYYDSKWYSNPALTVIETEHPIVKYFPTVVDGQGASQIKYGFIRPTQSATRYPNFKLIAKTVDGSARLSSFSYASSNSTLYYLMSPLNSWHQEDVYYRDLLIQNFYSLSL